LGPDRFRWRKEVLAIFSPRTTATVECNSFVSRDGSTASKLGYECIRLLAPQWRNDAGVFAVPTMDDSNDRAECEERNHRDPRELLWGDMLGHQ
jgi:hypothetical protein